MTRDVDVGLGAADGIRNGVGVIAGWIVADVSGAGVPGSGDAMAEVEDTGVAVLTLRESAEGPGDPFAGRISTGAVARPASEADGDPAGLVAFATGEAGRCAEGATTAASATAEGVARYIGEATGEGCGKTIAAVASAVAGPLVEEEGSGVAGIRATG